MITCSTPRFTSARSTGASFMKLGRAPTTERTRDRKSVVEGKSVDLGGCRIIKKKKKDDRGEDHLAKREERQLRERVWMRYSSAPGRCDSRRYHEKCDRENGTSLTHAFPIR